MCTNEVKAPELEEEVQKPEASHLVQLEQQEENTTLVTAPKRAEEKAALQQTLQNKEKWTQMKTTIETRLDGRKRQTKSPKSRDAGWSDCSLVWHQLKGQQIVSLDVMLHIIHQIKTKQNCKTLHCVYPCINTNISIYIFLKILKLTFYYVFYVC